MISTSEAVGLSSERLRNIDRWMHDYVDQKKLPGLVVMIARHGRIAYFESHGRRDLEAGLPMNDDTIFRIYSMTKPITSVAVMMLYEQGAFQLDDPIGKFIPAFNDTEVFARGDLEEYSTRKPSRPVTIRDLLTHTAGLTYSFMEEHTVDALYRKNKIDFQSRDMSLGDMVTKLAKLPLKNDPGSAWNYSNATDVLGYLVEVLTGFTLDAFIQERIARPLGMNDTGFHVPENKLDRLATSYTLNENRELVVHDPARDGRFAQPAVIHSGGGGLVSTAADYMRFCQMLLQNGQLDGVRLLGRKTVAYMRQNHLIGDLAANGQPVFSETSYEGIGFGLGFSVMLDPTRANIIGSPGEYSWGGMASTAFWIDPAEDMVVVLMTQLIPSSTYQIRRELRVLTYQALID